MLRVVSKIKIKAKDMTITRRNKIAGRPLADDNFSYMEDEDRHVIGIRVGYCDGCNSMLTLPQSVLQMIARQYDRSHYEIVTRVDKLPWPQRVMMKMVGFRY